MLFDTSELFAAIKDKSLSTPDRTLEILNTGSEDVNTRSRKHEETYLHLIAHVYQKDEDAPYLLPVVYQLSNAGIDACAVDQDGNTALHIAVKVTGARRLVRALLMIGVDPTIENKARQTAIQIAKSNHDNSKVMSLFHPGLWQAVTVGSTETVDRLLSNWCKVELSRNGVQLTDHAEQLGNNAITDAVQFRAKTILYVHYALAGDRQRLRPFLQQESLNKDPMTESYIDVTTGNFVTMPLIGEVTLLCLTAVVRKMIRKKCDVTADVSGKPLPLYVLENIAKAHDGFCEVYEAFVDKLDFTKFQKHTMAFLYVAYEKELPLSLMGKMAANGLDLFATDDEGHFLRDRILIKNANENPLRIADELKFVDDIIVHLATRGFTDYLRMLGECFYEHLVVVSRDGVSSLQALIDSVGVIEADKLVSYVTESQKLYRDLVHIIRIGHFTQFEQLVNRKVKQVKDKHGRTLVHHITLFEREPMLRYYMKTCRPNVNIQDKFGRTPLFWACAVEEGGEMEELLKTQGCSKELKDKTGMSPIDVKALTRKEQDAFLTEERSRDPGLDTYLFYRYMEIKEAIRCGDVGQVEEIRSKMYRDVPTKDIIYRMYQSDPPQRDLLSFAMEARRDGIAKCLLTLGLDWNVKYTEDQVEMTLLEAANKMEMKAVVRYIKFQIEEHEKQKEALKKLKNKGVLKEENK